MIVHRIALTGSFALAVFLLLPSLSAPVRGAEPEPGGATAPEAETDALDPEQQVRRLLDQLDPRRGRIELGGVAAIEVPEDFFYLDAEDTQLVLEAWGNPPGEPDLLGMLLPSGPSPLDDASWGVTIDYIADGHVSDREAAKIDYSELLETMRKEAKAESAARVKAGFEAMSLVGWAEPPSYDPASKKLYWAKELQFAGTPQNTLNYNIRILGRRGYLQLNFVASMTQLAEINAAKSRILELANFTPGNTYADFDPKVDKRAAYGIGALVAGGVLAKTGMLAKILIAFKKVWILAALGGAALFRRLFKRREEQGTA